MPGGRKSEYSPDIAADLCSRISTESTSLRAICDSNDEFPTVNTFYRWMLNHSELRELYARAKEEQLQILADEIVPLADTPIIAEKRTIKADGSEEVVRGDAVERTKVQIDSRKWLLSKLAPKKYGDKLDMNLAGKDGGPVQSAITIRFVKTEPSSE